MKIPAPAAGLCRFTSHPPWSAFIPPVMDRKRPNWRRSLLVWMLLSTGDRISPSNSKAL